MPFGFYARTLKRLDISAITPPFHEVFPAEISKALKSHRIELGYTSFRI